MKKIFLTLCIGAICFLHTNANASTQITNQASTKFSTASSSGIVAASVEEASEWWSAAITDGNGHILGIVVGNEATGDVYLYYADGSYFHYN